MHRRNLTPANANVAADHPSVADQLIHDLVRQLERDRKTDTFGGFPVVALIKGEGVDPHQFAQRVHQRPAGVTVVDRGIRLQEVLPSGRVQTDTPGGADNPLGDGLPEVIRVTDSQHHVADMRRAFTVNRDHR
ncbi:hypothetical protein D3C75_983510 [compost metagenome]